MNRYSGIFKEFVKVLARSRVSMAGAVVSSLILPVLIVFVLLDMQGVVQNPYFGFLIYMVMGPLFMAGLVTVVVGMLLFKDREEIGLFTLEYIREQMNMPGRFIRIRKHIYFSFALFVLTLVVIGVVSYKGFSYTESVGFCGQFCHTVMEPEYITYQNSPHSRVPCVDCHISSNAGMFTKSKITGVKMIFSTVLARYERPIVTPIASLRPTQEVCLQCHRPEMFHGNKLYVKDSFLPDETSTHVQTVLLMRVGSSGYRGSEAHGIHWHVSPTSKTYYRGVPGKPDLITGVKIIDQDGKKTVFERSDKAELSGGEEVSDYRLMDCLDCHNRPTHVFLGPEEALDNKIAMGMISRTLPYIKRQGLELLLADYGARDEAWRRISVDLEKWYQDEYPTLFPAIRADLDRAMAGIFQAWSENVFPEMNISWNTYESNLGHRDGKGCFRCHCDVHVDSGGKTISSACDLCHIVLADREVSPDIMRILHGGEVDRPR